MRLLDGIYSTKDKISTSLPVNLIPYELNINRDGGMDGYLAVSDGIETITTVGEAIRGITYWNGLVYFVKGSKLKSYSEAGTIATIGDVGTDRLPVTFDYSFTYLAVTSNLNLFLYDGTTLSQVTDDDLGDIFKVRFVDGYFFLTDGEHIVVTELDDPFSINPLKYGSSEYDPDSIVGMDRVRDELLVINRHTIETFRNVGGSGFPLARIEGGMVMIGAIGRYAYGSVDGVLFFVGGGRNEPIAVYSLTSSTSTAKVSNREIENIINAYPSEIQKNIQLEILKGLDSRLVLYVHLPDKTLALDLTASQKLDNARYIWYMLSSSETGIGAYEGRYHTYAYGNWFVGGYSVLKFGKLSREINTHFGQDVAWSINTPIVYNKGHGVVLNSLELVCFPGRGAVNDEYISLERSNDGLLWSSPVYSSAGNIGNRTKRIIWFRLGAIRNYAMFRISGRAQSRLMLIDVVPNIIPLRH